MIKGTKGQGKKWLSSRFLLLAVICISIFLGCGKKLPPLPPESSAPEPVKDIQAVTKDGQPTIIFSLPRKNVDGSDMKDLAGFKIKRRTVEDKNGCKGCPELFPDLFDIDVEYPKGGTVIEKGQVIFTDNNLTEGSRYEYKVVGYNKAGYDGPESKKVSLAWGKRPGAPQNLLVKGGDRSAELTWSPPAIKEGETSATGYNVYRRRDGEKYPVAPQNQSVVKNSSYTDIGLKNGQRYFYVVRALSEVDGLMIEGPSSGETEVIPAEVVMEEIPISEKPRIEPIPEEPTIQKIRKERILDASFSVY